MPTVEPEQPTNNSFIEKLITLLTKLIELINRIIKFFTNSGARI